MKVVVRQWKYVNFRQWATLGAHWSPPEFKSKITPKVQNRILNSIYQSNQTRASCCFASEHNIYSYVFNI
ncbi:hypothetical protein VNO80_10097 [Phaseolus coccineus]|uniref:Uncharacterized protein n=1 Tax=Phaseolus coccineus TaxID=3886 RepID=A0AAN9RA61_PHACN